MTHPKRTLSHSKKKRIGFISSRIAGTDGVTLETKKWIDVLERSGYSCYYFSGEHDLLVERAYVVPEASSTNPKILKLTESCFGNRTRDGQTTKNIQRIKDVLKRHLYEFVSINKIDLLIAENSLSLPRNIPLGLAITEFIAETGIPAIAHHHNFYWDHDKFLVNGASDYLRMAFPPTLPSLRHVTLNTLSREDLSHRTGQSSVTIPNVMDFDNPPPPMDEHAKGLRGAIGVSDSELMILQPTHIIKRKRIEQAIDLVRRLKVDATLVITHPSTDEELAYEQWLREYADMLGVNILFVADRIRSKRDKEAQFFTMQDMYQNADLVTYPSGREGFGNIIIEAFYYKKPVVVNRYSTYQTDVAPRGFTAIDIDGLVSEETLEEKRELITNEILRTKMVEQNYQLGLKHFSYGVLYHRLRHLLDEFFGDTGA